eukprot:gb/GECG01010225.1/.p1 GENE.gb/GECG01010225.1/~~gb/GECG01010225.1/.p1  ORF type:complete len:897 (+),score=125.31 gb/GECG01010225.1/:1-2691(+)
MQENEDSTALRVLHTQARLLSKQFLHESAITVALTALADTKQYRHALTRLVTAQVQEHQRLLKQYAVYLEAQFLVGSVLDEAQQYRRAQSHLQIVRKGLQSVQQVLENTTETAQNAATGKGNSATVGQDCLNRWMPHGVVPTKGVPNFLNYAYVTYKIARCHFAVGELEEMFQMLECIPWEMRTLAVHYDLGKEYERRGHIENSYNSYREVLRANPFATEVIERLLALGVGIHEVEGLLSKEMVPNRYRQFLQSIARAMNAKHQSYHPAACKRLALMVANRDDSAECSDTQGTHQGSSLLSSEVLGRTTTAGITAGQWKVFDVPDWLSKAKKRVLAHFQDDQLLKSSFGMFPEGHEALETMGATWLADADRYEDAIVAFKRLQKEYPYTTNGRDAYALMLYRRAVSLQEMSKLNTPEPPSKTPHLLSKLVENLMEIDRHKLALLSVYETEGVANEGQRLQIRGSGGGTVARPEPWIAAAAAAITRNEIDCANSLCDIAAAVDPYHIQTLTVTALALTAEKSYHAAVGYYSTVFSRQPSVSCLSQMIPCSFALDDPKQAQKFARAGMYRFPIDGRMHCLYADALLHVMSLEKVQLSPSDITHYATIAHSEYQKGSTLAPWWIKCFIGQALALVQSGADDAIEKALTCLRDLKQRGDGAVVAFPQSYEEVQRLMNSSENGEVMEGEARATVPGSGILSGFGATLDSEFAIGSDRRIGDSCPELGVQYSAIVSIKIAEILALSSRWSEATEEMNAALSLCPSLPGGKKMLKSIQQRIGGNQSEGEDEEPEALDASDNQGEIEGQLQTSGDGGSGATPDQNMDEAVIYSGHSSGAGGAAGRRLFHDGMTERSGIIDDTTEQSFQDTQASAASEEQYSPGDSGDTHFTPNTRDDMEVEFDS